MSRSRGVYNRVYTEEKWLEVNSFNKAIRDDFLIECKQRKMSPGTIEGYAQDTRIVLIKILDHFENKSILDMNKKDFRRLSIIFDASGMSPARCNRIHSACNSMLEFVEDDDDYEYDNNMSKKVHGIPREKVKCNEDDFFFTYDEFIKVRDILVERNQIQNAVLWSLAFDSAGRRNEIYQVEKDNLLKGNKTNIVRAKRGKKYPLVYLDDTKALIELYLKQRGDDNIPSLWIKEKKGVKSEVSSITLYRRMATQINRVLEEVRGEKSNIFFHTCRHSRIECLTQGTDDRLKDENGKNRVYPIEKVQVFVHHEDLSTTSSYCKNHDEDTINDMFGFA